jgi:hypothetical protein
VWKPISFQINLGLEKGVRHLPYVFQDAHGCGRNALAVWRMQNLVNQSLAPIHQLLYDDVLVHGVPPAEECFVKSFRQDTSWTTYLQFRGTPSSNSPRIRIAYDSITRFMSAPPCPP